jgi:hypothetical protein
MRPGEQQDPKYFREAPYAPDIKVDDMSHRHRNKPFEHRVTFVTYAARDVLTGHSHYCKVRPHTIRYPLGTLSAWSQLPACARTNSIVYQTTHYSNTGAHPFGQPEITANGATYKLVGLARRRVGDKRRLVHESRYERYL